MNSHLITYLATARADDLLRHAEQAGTLTRQRQGHRPSIAVVGRAVRGVRRSISIRQQPRADLAIRRELLAPNGYLHAAALIALADTACGYRTSAAHARAGFTTVERDATFLATARDGRLECHARIHRAGRSTQVSDAEVSCRGRTHALCRCAQLLLGP